MRTPDCFEERYLLIVDHDDDDQDIITVIREGRPCGAPNWADVTEGGRS